MTKHVMPQRKPRDHAMQGRSRTVVPDEQNPTLRGGACWSCHFQRGCARRALAQPCPSSASGRIPACARPGLNRTRAQLAIVAGLAMGHPLHPARKSRPRSKTSPQATDPVPLPASARARRAAPATPTPAALRSNASRPAANAG
ncbi:hypothetical protein I553_3559 [Mycobacterium xenopi 4042]|uniref:Uncharacterized protein n=1 Tax=Mycobacterium xenopi 4042 TaxID=1299334 RepID=X8AP09_MYCXE|nr:hypothetical protein I553_3559 [Mycobacterium xenopi 4042]